jgi:pimeloyl-ACP methyl ester carboxylesterase
MMKFLDILILLSINIMIASATVSSDTAFVETGITLQTSTGEIYGTLTVPGKLCKMPVALIIAGSGPTDRDGNNPMMKNNSLKLLAYELANNGIATLRYDKRGIAESKAAMSSEKDLRFDDYVSDAKEWIQILKKDDRFSEVTVIGHSEGSLIGMLAGASAARFVSIAGFGQSADKILKEQLSSQPGMVQDLSFPIIDSLKDGALVENVPPVLNSLFRRSVQPYMISWFRYDPQDEIRKLSVPILILQGTNDIQVGVENARYLSDANPGAEFILINDMNHIFRITTGDRQANLATYGNGSMPVAEELVKTVTDFIISDRSLTR